MGSADRLSVEEDIPTMSLDPRFTFEKFVVGKPNEFAYAAACRVAETIDAVYNPLFLYGPVGHGKTHLMHSMAHVMMRQSKGQVKILYLSAEKFMYYFIRALRYKTILSFKERLRSVDVLMVDDVQFISGKESTQEEFFHTFNALVDLGKQVIISADQSPADLNGIQERMKSRLGCGLVADLHPTTYELRVGILQSKALAHGVELPEDIIDFLASHMTASVRELEGALTRVIAHSSLVGRTLTVDLARTLLKDSLRPHSRDVTIDDIQKKVTAYFRIKISDLNSPKRARSIVRPRQIAMYLAKCLTTVSLPAIGRHFGGRDHTTVMHSVATITELIQRDTALREDVTLLRHSLENR
jgi:chromosomal replication initiator protein